MAWLLRDKAPISKGQKTETPEGLWFKCSRCHEICYKQDFQANYHVCPTCRFHYPLPALDRIYMLLDEGSVVFCDQDVRSTDPLKFVDRESYKVRLDKTIKKLGRDTDAFISAEGTLLKIPVQLGVFDFEFMGGSMGSVVGEKIARLFLRSAAKKQPAIVVSASGGARMQEGILSLMQMAKTCAALSELRDARVPFISILSDPTTGGVAASFAMLGDINIAEPDALIGFAGPRVIQQTIRQKLPEGFQRSEYLLEHGMLDMICHRSEMRIKISEILKILLKM